MAAMCCEGLGFRRRSMAKQIVMVKNARGHRCDPIAV